MFGEEERGRLLDELVTAARADGRIAAAAVLGSGAAGTTDRWSDVDLGFGVTGDRDAVLADWTARMYADHGAVDHLDIVAGPSLYRAFLLRSTLQVDLSFTPADRFGAIGPAFRLLFGTAVDREPPPRPDPHELVGMGWLYAVHARSSIARGRPWQAEYMISGLRDTVLALACVRHDLPAVQARGTDRLPPDVTRAVEAALVREPAPAELTRAFRAATEVFLAEAARVDPARAERLSGPLRGML